MPDFAHSDRCASLLGPGCDCRSPFDDAPRKPVRFVSARWNGDDVILGCVMDDGNVEWVHVPAPDAVDLGVSLCTSAKEEMFRVRD